MRRNLLKTLFAGLFLSMLAPLTASADVEINPTNFPDANFRNWLLRQSYGQDGKITDEEIKGITSIDVSGKSICSLQGIEHFTALTSLYCSLNQLISLDVSKNRALTYLDCRDSQLTSLDVSKNTALTSLYCYLNKLTSLDVSSNAALEKLWCDGNQLTSLDVSHNTALTSLQCSSNQLTSLNVSKNTALGELACQMNQLTSLDVSKNTILASLDCHYNQLTSLDVSNNMALTRLNCSGNQLTSLDVSKNTALGELACHENQLKGMSMDAFIKSLPVNISGQNYYLYIYSDSENEENACTRSQVATIKVKGWIPYNISTWSEYEGRDDESADIKSPIRRVHSKAMPSTA